MMKIAMLILSFGIVAFGSFADAQKHAARPCQEKIQLRVKARQALYQCLGEWDKEKPPKEGEVQEDCSAKLLAYIEGVNDVRACRKDAQQAGAKK